MEEIALKQYYEMLKVHDWWYENSDDHAVWSRGRANAFMLRKISTQSPDHHELYVAFMNHHWYGYPEPKEPE